MESRGAKVFDVKQALGFVLGMVLSCAAFASEESEVKSVMTQYFDAAKVFDTSEMASLMHPEALGRFRRAIDRALHGEKKELAEEELLPLFSLTSMAKYTDLTDLELYQRLNETVRNTQPNLVAIMETSTFEFVAEAARGDVVYVTYILTIDVEGHEISKDVVQKLKKHNGQWLLLLPADGEASIAEIAARYN